MSRPSSCCWLSLLKRHASIEPHLICCRSFSPLHSQFSLVISQLLHLCTALFLQLVCWPPPLPATPDGSKVVCPLCHWSHLGPGQCVPAGFEDIISCVLQLPLVWRMIWHVDFGQKNDLCICGKPSALCAVSGVERGTVAPDPLPPHPKWWLLSALCLHSLSWLALSVRTTLCPWVRFRESIQFLFDYTHSPLFFQCSLSVGFAWRSAGFAPFCCCSNLQFRGFCYHVQSVSADFTGVFGRSTVWILLSVLSCTPVKSAVSGAFAACVFVSGSRWRQTVAVIENNIPTHLSLASWLRLHYFVGNKPRM